MFDKNVADLTIADIQQLVDTVKEPEGQFVDYKQQLDSSNDAKKELVKDVTAFANAQGGYLVIGIKEEDGLPTEITGTPKRIGRQKVDEWINAILSTNADPKVDYNIKVINYQNDKVVVVMYIKDSSKKPHMMTYDKRNNYFKRHQDISSAATNQEVRDMFAEGQATLDRLKDFLTDKNLLDVRYANFGLTNYSRRLINRSLQNELDWRTNSACVISLIPRTLNDELIDPVGGSTREWINTNTKGYQPIPTKDLYMTHENQVDIDGIAFLNQLWGHDNPEGVRRYIEFLNNGYVEFGTSSDLFYTVNGPDNGRVSIMHLSHTIALTHAMINFANKFYPAVNYDDKVYLQLSIRNIKGFALGGFDNRQRNGQGGWAEPYTAFYDNPPTVQNYSHIKIIRLLTPNGQNVEVNDEVLGIATQLSRAFGEQQVKCFDDNRTYNPSSLQSLL